jgi:hypothetical protein
MYQFSDDLSYQQFFRFDKKWIENMNWAMLPKASKAVFPIIAAYCNAAGDAFPSETTIAILSGIREKAVRAGINGLVGFPGFNLSYYVTRRGRRAKKFRMEFPPNAKGRSFFFHKCIIEGGNWPLLKSVSQAIYPVMRFYAYFDFDIYSEAEEVDVLDDLETIFGNRGWDICEADIGLLQKYAAISRPSVYEAFTDLQEKFLIEPLNLGDAVRRWKVFISPPKRFKPEYLNKTIVSRFIQEDDCTNSTGDSVKKQPQNVKKRLKFVKKAPTK